MSAERREPSSPKSARPILGDLGSPRRQKYRAASTGEGGFQTPNRRNDRFLFPSPMRFPASNLRNSTPPTALVAPQVSASTKQEVNETRSPRNRQMATGHRLCLPLDTPSTSNSRLFSRLNRNSAGSGTRGEGAFLISLQSAASRYDGGSGEEHPGRQELLGVSVEPAIQSAVYRNPSASARNRTPRRSLTENQDNSSSDGRTIFAEEIWDPRLPSPITEPDPILATTLPLRRESLGSLCAGSSTESVVPHNDTGSNTWDVGSRTSDSHFSSNNINCVPNANFRRSPTPEPTRKILADHAELIRNLQSHIGQLEGRIGSCTSRETSRPVSPYAFSSGFQSANSSGSALSLGFISGGYRQSVHPLGLGSMDGMDYFGPVRTLTNNSRNSYPDRVTDSGRSRSALELLEKEGQIARLNRRLERAQSDLELAQLQENYAEKQLNQIRTENETLKKKNEELTKKNRAYFEELAGARKHAKENIESQDAIIQELEEIIDGAQEKWQRAADADEWRKEAAWARLQKEALECVLVARETEIKGMEKELKQRSSEPTTPSSVSLLCMGVVSRRLGEQRRDLAGVTHRLQSLLETTKHFRKHRGRKALDLDTLLGLEKPEPFTKEVLKVGDVKMETERSTEEVKRVKEALKALNEEMVEFFLDRTAENIKLS